MGESPMPPNPPVGFRVEIPAGTGVIVRMKLSLRPALIACLPALCAFSHAAQKPNAVVAADGSGDFKTIQAAIDKSPQTASTQNQWTIFVKSGTYNEVVYIQREKRGLRLVGENAATTVITHNLSGRMQGPDGKEIGTFRTSTLQLDADDFTAENITFENSAGRVGQALAIRVDGDRAVFRGCSFLGYQDTILTNRGRQYFENCHIAGATDFIFGGATAWFEKCDILCVGNGYITAASTPQEQPHGYVFSHCRVSADASKPDILVYLGRPWRPFAATAFLNCDLGACVRPAGWHNWNDPSREKTVRYAEFGSTGAGAAPDKRVPWAKKLTADEAAAFTPASVLGGIDNWNPSKQ